jgi:hypothetical protein
MDIQMPARTAGGITSLNISAFTISIKRVKRFVSAKIRKKMLLCKKTDKLLHYEALIIHILTD